MSPSQIFANTFLSAISPPDAPTREQEALRLVAEAADVAQKRGVVLLLLLEVAPQLLVEVDRELLRQQLFLVLQQLLAVLAVALHDVFVQLLVGQLVDAVLDDRDREQGALDGLLLLLRALAFEQLLQLLEDSRELDQLQIVRLFQDPALGLVVALEQDRRQRLQRVQAHDLVPELDFSALGRHVLAQNEGVLGVDAVNGP